MNIDFIAMMYARDKHKNQLRKYTENPYFDHLAEVVGIVSAFIDKKSSTAPHILSIAWLHDVVEDTEVTLYQLGPLFGHFIVDGVRWLSDLEEGNREIRKRLSRERLAQAPDYIQTIKVADLISNTASIVKHNPEFAKVYLEEKRLMLDVLVKANNQLVQIAREQIEGL